ncbi:hypothetical protein DSO57_1003094 [Entomophthora muscae]|uniref:Uncharacterized protein n=1 Tax=Entomophthora muscae TaxID=34485 RepID=A0ACC2UHN1_9FUNG|nr:hypothetical protein DSO57_1003094 [Entomophthora muscae]
MRGRVRLIFPKLELAIEAKLKELFRCKGSCEITLVEYLGEEIKIKFCYKDCTPVQFTQALLETTELSNISNNGSRDWIPLDTQSAISMYPDYNKKNIKSPTDLSQLGSNHQVSTPGSSAVVSLNSPSVYDWRLAHLEEAFNSFSPDNQAHFNIRKEGVIVVSVVREWLVSHRMLEFMHSIFALSQLIDSKSPSDMQILFSCLSQFKSIFGGFHQARAIYQGLAKYKEHFREIYSDHEAQMTAHLEALELHLDVILDPSLEPNSQTTSERIVELSQLLQLCSKTMMEFTVALQRKLASVAESRDTAHKRLVGNAVMAVVSVGVAVYSRPTRLAARAAHLTAVVGSFGLAYYFYNLEKELESLKKEQEKAIELSASMTTCLREYIQSFSSRVTRPFEKPQAEMLANLSRLHFVSLKDDLHDMRMNLDQLALPKPQSFGSRYISWW